MTEVPAGHGPLASPGYHLLMAAHAWRRELAVGLRPLGITPTQFDLLGALGWLGRTRPDPTQQEVADFAAMDRMMLSRLVSVLEARGLVTRRADLADARLRRLRLTDSGRELLGPASAAARAVDAALFGDVVSRTEIERTLRGIAQRAAPPSGGRPDPVF